MPRDGVGHRPGVSLNVSLISPAWGRYEVSRFVFRQWAWLISELAPRGIGMRAVVIADDENLGIAAEHGFDTIEMANDPVAAKLNAGFRHARDSDFVAFVGSDDWLHPDLFDLLNPEWVVSGREITLVNLQEGVLTRMGSRSLHGVIPWLIPTGFLPDDPVDAHLNRGLDLSLYRRIRRRHWVFHDPHPHTRVDFKSDVNLTPWSRIGRSIGTTPPEPAWAALREWFPDDLIELAEHREYATA